MGMRGFVWFLPLDRKLAESDQSQNLSLFAFKIPTLRLRSGQAFLVKDARNGASHFGCAQAKNGEMGYSIFGWALEVTNAHGLLAVDRQLRSLL